MKRISFLRGVPADSALSDLAPAIMRAYESAFSKYGTALLQYSTAGTADFMGFFRLKEWLAEKYRATESHVPICVNGGMEMLSMLFKALNQGACVLTESATYDRALTDALRYGLNPLGVKVTGEGADLGDLENFFKQGSIVPRIFYQVVYHQNPLGITPSQGNIEAVAGLCKEKGCLYVCDVAYEDLRYDGSENFRIDLGKKAFANTCIIGSFTKTLSPGTKCGYGLVPRPIFETLNSVISNTRLNPNYPTQAAIFELVQSGYYANYLEYLKKAYRPRMDALNSALREYLPGLEVPAVTGGFFVLLSFRGVSSGKKFIASCKDQGVDIALSEMFPANCKEDHVSKGLPIRLTFPSLDPEAIREGIRILADVYRDSIG